MADSAVFGLPEQLRDFRARRNWTQADLARHLGTTAQTVSRWEQGSPPQEGLRRRLERLLRDGPAATESSVIQWPLSPPVDASEHDLQKAAIAAAIARAGAGAAMSPGEVVFMRSIFLAVGLDWAE